MAELRPEKIGKNCVFFPLFFQFKLIFREIRSVSKTTKFI